MLLCVNGGPKSNDGAMCKQLCMSQLMGLGVNGAIHGPSKGASVFTGWCQFDSWHKHL